MATKKIAPASAAYLPPEWDEADANAIQHLAAGTADEAQQKRALKWIIELAAATYDFPFRPGDSDRETNIALGRQFVGQQIVKLIKVDLLALQRKQQNA